MLMIYIPILLTVVGVVTALFIWGLVRARRRSRLILDAPLCKAEDLPNGFAKMRGRIEAVDEDDVLESPMTRTLCVYYKFKVEELRSAGRSTYWATIVTDIKDVRAVVADKTGDARIELYEAKMLPMPTETVSCGGLFGASPPSFEGRLQRRYGFSVMGLLFHKTMRYTETVIDEGLSVVVAGEVKWNKDGQPRFRKSEVLPVMIARSESELDSHFRGRVYGWLAAAILVPLALLIVGFFIGMAIDDSEGPPNHPAPNFQQQPFIPPVQRNTLDDKLIDLRGWDPATRIRAANDLTAMPIDFVRRHEVANALNPLIEDTDTRVRDAGMQAAAKWGTLQDNEASLKKVTLGKDQDAAATARRLLNDLK
jgi:hypothetical protein